MSGARKNPVRIRMTEADRDYIDLFIADGRPLTEKLARLIADHRKLVAIPHPADAEIAALNTQIAALSAEKEALSAEKERAVEKEREQDGVISNYILEVEQQRKALRERTAERNQKAKRVKEQVAEMLDLKDAHAAEVHEIREGLAEEHERALQEAKESVVAQWRKKAEVEAERFYEQRRLELATLKKAKRRQIFWWAVFAFAVGWGARHLLEFLS